MKQLIFLFLLFGSTCLFAQPQYDAKRDYVWIFGGSKNQDSSRHIILDFKSDTMSLLYREGTGMDLFQTNASICDTAGNFLFFSNGCELKDSNFQLIPGADKINQGPYWNSICNSSFSNLTFGYVIVNGCWILPVEENTFKVFYVDKINDMPNEYTSGIRFSTILRSAFDGDLKIAEKDQYYYPKSVDPTKRAVVRHGNGRDWWLVNPVNGTKIHYSFLIDSTSNIYAPVKNETPDLEDLNFNTSGQACFSPGGSIYASLDYENQCLIFDFDRCNGEMSNLRKITPLLSPDSIFGVTGLAISPNSRFLYLMTNTIITQYDLQVNDIEASAIVVAVRDSWAWVVSGISFPPVFYQSQLGPDGKIYVFNAANRSTFAVIESPDSLGLACNVIQHKYFLPDKGPIRQPPRFPNFRLGALAGSPCDTLTVSTNEIGTQNHIGLKLQPNPATEYTIADITLSDYNPAQPLFLTLTDGLGRVIRRKQVPPYTPLQRIETGDLAAGLYFVGLSSGSRVLVVKKLVVVRE
jgi:hypothetical protein